jgi:hypothetical protein
VRRWEALVDGIGLSHAVIWEVQMHHDRLKRRRSQAASLQTSGLTSAKHRSDGNSCQSLPGDGCLGCFRIRFCERAQSAQTTLATLYSIASMNRP